MEEAYRTAKSLIISIKGDLDACDKQAGSGGITSYSGSLQRKLADLTATSRSLTGASKVAEIGSSAQGAIWQHKVAHVAEETISLQRCVEAALHRATMNKERQQLLGTVSADGQRGRLPQASEGVALRALESSKRLLEETLQVGSAALLELGVQRDTMKAVQKKALDVLHSLGLSDSLLRMIENRHFVDKAIVYGVMLTMALLVILYVYYKM